MKRRYFQHPFALGLLTLVVLSILRQISFRLEKWRIFSPYLVYVGYLLLLLWWGYSVWERITQKNMKIFLCGQIGIMAFWITVRLAQETCIGSNLSLMRATGYWICIPIILVPLFSLFASLGLGQWENYHMSRTWYLLLLPAAGLIALVLTDPYHHFVFSVDPSEPQPNLFFHPYIGVGILFGWVFFCTFLRMGIIYKKHTGMGRKRIGIWMSTFLEPLGILIFSIPYLLSSFVVRVEVVEYSVGAFAIIASFWELYIRLGLVPVNTQYAEVFQTSNIAMQILDEAGNCLINSDYSEPLNREMFDRLRREKSVLFPEGKEWNLNPISGAYVVWSKDVSQMSKIVEKLSDTVEDLEKDSMLRRREIKIRSEEAILAEKSRLYDQLSNEVGTQLALLEEKLEQSTQVADPRRLFQEICYIGTYIKRRSNMRLIAQEEGILGIADMELMLRDMRDGLQDLDIRCEIAGMDTVIPSTECFFRSMDVLEEKLEGSEFRMQKIKIWYRTETSFQLDLQMIDGNAVKTYGG